MEDTYKDVWFVYFLLWIFRDQMLLDLGNNLDHGEIHKSVWLPACLLVIQPYFLVFGIGARIFGIALELEDISVAFLRRI